MSIIQNLRSRLESRKGVDGEQLDPRTRADLIEAAGRQGVRVERPHRLI
jgi:hypothetical protein